MGLIPALHQFSNLFQSGLDGFDRPSVAKWDRFKTGQKLGGFQKSFLLLHTDNHANKKEKEKKGGKKPPKTTKEPPPLPSLL